jgi:hypothetical protein
MKNKKHGNEDERQYIEWVVMTLVTALTVISIVVEIATWFIK